MPTEKPTDPETYFNRRMFLRGAALVGSTAATAYLYRRFAGGGPASGIFGRRAQQSLAYVPPTTGPSTNPSNAGFFVDEKPTSFADITHYNNFYEFSTDKQAVADAAAGFVTSPWSITIDGLCRKPGTLPLETVLGISPIEQRLYRMRCVEGWSMVIPWNGFSLSKLLDRVEPLSAAKYVAFQTLMDPARLPGEAGDLLAWPYVEGLRMDEAMHPLTMLASGIYGQKMPPQDGAPIRLVVPWKYGFKGIKSIVKISLVADQPPTTWSAYAPERYGFYSNVNPDVGGQEMESRIGEFESRPTLMFNGYADEVGYLYAGMDLRKYY